MPKKRKTFSIATLLHKINQRNATSTCSPEVRQGWNSVLADVLMEAEVYAGFNYLGPEEVPLGQRPGIAFQDKNGTSLKPTDFYERLDAEHAQKLLEGESFNSPNGDERVFPDESRRFYYVDQSLLKEYGKLIRPEED